MFNIQCEDLMILRFSNTKSSMLYNLLSAGVALWVILDELLDKTTVQDEMQCEVGVQFYFSTRRKKCQLGKNVNIFIGVFPKLILFL
jgi:hypothetical protein